jgi:hypothetical protein
MGDVARALDLEDWPTLDRARLGFEWVIREVSLKERIRQEGFAQVEDDVLPSRFILQIGYGTSRERAFVFLALLQQLGIDGCMVAAPGENGKGKWWLPGVLVAHEEKTLAGGRVLPGIYLFDTRLGVPLPGPKGDTIARLEEVMAGPDEVRKRLPRAISARAVPDQIAKAEVYLVCSLAGLSPRMKHLEQKLGIEGKYLLATDLHAAKKQQERFQKAFPKDLKVPVRFWPRMESPRSAAEVKRVKETGLAMDPMPTWRAKYPPHLDPVLYDNIDGRIGARYAEFVRVPRGLLMQGRIDDAIKQLLHVQTIILQSQDQYLAELKDAPDRDREADAWCAQLKDAKARLSAAREEEDAGDAKLEKEQADARREIAELTGGHSPVMRRIVYRLMTTDLAKESTYLICLCMQEKAEQLERKLQRVSASAPRDGAADKALADARLEAHDAWANAQDRWHTFASEYGLTGQAFKNRLGEIQTRTRTARVGSGDKTHAEIALGLYELLALDLSRSVTARVLQARAWEKAGQPGAVKVLEQEGNELEALEKSGHLDAFKKYPRNIRTYKDGVVGYTSPANVDWLRAAVEIHLNRMRKRQ